MKKNDIVLYLTSEGNIEVAITKISGDYATIIWNESFGRCIIGKSAIVKLNKLKEIN